MKVLNKSILVYVLILIVGLTFTVPAQKMLKADGTKIVDQNGNEFFFKGMGLGSWLVPEGYMFNMEGFANSKTEIKNKIIDLVGTANADIFFDKFRDNFVTEEDIDSLASWGFNMVRLPMHYDLMTPKDQPFVYIEKGFTIIDNLLKWCKKNNMYVILDLHAAPGGQSANAISDYDSNYPSLWESETNKLRTIQLWGEIAKRYANEEYIAGYDLLNEPAWDLGSQNADLRQLLVNITKAIRDVDTNHILFVEGNWYATDFSGLSPKWDNNMSYSFHRYWSDVSSKDQIQGYLSLRNSQNAPLWMSESGENSNAWFTDFVKLLNSEKIGWTWWTLKKFESISSVFSVPVSSEFKKLMDYWNGRGSKPDATTAMNALMEQAEFLKAQYCKIGVGMIDALTRQPYDDTLLPFAQNNIPGIIYATNYDYGNLGNAYYDTDPSNVAGNGSYNNGWVYRNDGVDIEACSDNVTNGYNVGWIESGEWLKYTVNIKTTGTYDLLTRVAGEGNDGKIMFLMDNVPASGLENVPNTGGWQNWQTLRIPNLELEKGQHVMWVRTFNGGFNLNYFQFDLITDVKSENAEIPEEFSLSQNYPNPFNPTTSINFSIPNKTNVKLAIFSITGELIATLIDNQNYVPGNYKLDFDGSTLASGMYIYRLITEHQILSRKMILLK